MKNIILIFAVAGIFAACKNNEAKVESAATVDSLSNTQKVVAKPVAVKETHSTTTTTNAAPEKKKGWSNAAKGAVIGGAAGAVGGAVVDKNHRAQGAVIGAAVGAGAGYLIGKHKDKKKAATSN